MKLVRDLKADVFSLDFVFQQSVQCLLQSDDEQCGSECPETAPEVTRDTIHATVLGDSSDRRLVSLFILHSDLLVRFTSYKYPFEIEDKLKV